MRLRVEEVVRATGGKLISGSSETVVRGISTDSRTLKKGDLFFALKGGKFDGHDYVEAALRRGVSGVVVSRLKKSRSFRADDHVICVPDTLRALGDLASYWRRQFPIPVVAVTGSNGKTTTKEMIAAILKEKYRVLKTEGNFNNLIGLPLTLFRLGAVHEVAVLEMGMSIPGEIRRLTEIALPQAGVITSIGRAHLQGLKTLKGIARAKGELLEGLSPDGVAFLNGKDRFFLFLKNLSHAPVKKNLLAKNLHSLGIRGQYFEVVLKNKSYPFSLKILGKGNVDNALAAIRVGDYFGIPTKKMQRALARLRPKAGRLEPIVLKRWTILNDSYNANPDSMNQALDVLQQMSGVKGRRVAIFGEMLELSRTASTCHRELGRKAIERKVDLLVGLGRFAEDFRRGALDAGARPNQVITFRMVQESFKRIPHFLKKGDLILVKGSHAMRMDKLVEILRN